MSDHGAIDEQVRELVRSHRPELERLVDQALEHELAQLVEQRLAAHSGAPAVPAPVAKAPTKTCVSCGEDKPTSAFEKYRRACRDCRRAEMRERAQRRAVEQPADVEEPPRTDTDPVAEDPLPVT